MCELAKIQTECIERGYLGENEKLMSVIEDDNSTLHRLHVTHDQLHDILEKVILHFTYGNTKREEITNIDKEMQAKYIKYKDTWTYVESEKKKIFCDKMEVIKVTWSDGEVCPFGDNDHSLPLNNTDWLLHDTINDTWFTFSGSHPHHIKEHHFFQGKTSLYRLDAEDIIKFFKIEPELRYDTGINKIGMVTVLTEFERTFNWINDA